MLKQNTINSNLEKILVVTNKIKIKHLLLALILALSFLVRIYRIYYPEKYYFDEVYHAFTAGAYAQNDPAGYEWWHTSTIPGTAYEWLHPPISKLFMAASILMFGDNSFAWRFPSAVFGVLVIWGVWWLAKNLFKNDFIALMAAFFAMLDGLLLTQSRIAMNDIYVTFFIVMALGFYWKWKESGKNDQNIIDKIFKKNKFEGKYLMMASVFTGLAVSSKWSGVFVVGIVGIWEILMFLAGGIKLSQKHLLRFVKKSFLLLLAFGVVPIAMYVLSYGQFWLQGHSIEQFAELHNQIWWYQTHLDATHPYESRPWQWALDLKPVWFFVEYWDGARADIYALSNPAISWGGLVVMLTLAVWFVMKKRSVYLFLIICYLSVWVPWFLSPRIMFYYHYTPAIPFLCVALGLVTAKLVRSGNLGKIIAGAYVMLVFGLFVYFYPRLTAIPLPTSWADSYLWFESWR